MTDVKVTAISIKKKVCQCYKTKMEQKANIKFCVKLEKKFAETYELMKKVYGDDCMSRTQFTEDLGKRKVFARFVPHQLNAPPHKTKKVNEFFMKNRFVSLTTLRIRLIYHRVTTFCSQN